MTQEKGYRSIQLEWVTPEYLGNLFGFTELEIEMKLKEYKLKKEDGTGPNQRALESGYSREIHHWFGANTYEWKLDLVYDFFERDPEIIKFKENLIQEGLSTVTQAFMLSESGFHEESKAYEQKFWQGIPRGVYEKVYETVISMFKRNLPDITKNMLSDALSESKALAEFLEYTPFRKQGLKSFLKEIDSNTHSQSRLTISLGSKCAYHIELKREDKALVFGDQPDEYTKLVNFLPYGILGILHTDVEGCGKAIQTGVQRVCGYRLGTNERGFFWKQIPTEEFKRIYENDPFGGKLPAGPEIQFS